jgi:HK97 family phage major capsid protein
MPVLNQTTLPAGGSAFYGGIVVRWLEADEPKQATQPSFRQVSLIAKELSAYTEVSNTLLEDSAVALEDFLQSPLGFSGAIAHAEDTSFLMGDGNGTPLGALKSPCRVVISRNTAGRVLYKDVVKMMSRMLMGGSYVWIAHQVLMNELFVMQDEAGNNIWLPHTSGMKGSPFGTMLGFPINFTEKVPTTGQEADLSLCNFNYYMIGDRQSITVDTSQHYLFQKNQVAYRVIVRVDGRPWLSQPIPLADGGISVSPFVVLGEAAGS